MTRLRSSLLPGSICLILACATPTASDRAGTGRVPAASAQPPAPLPESGLVPRTLSRLDAAPRSPVERLILRERYTLQVQDAELAGFLLGLARGLPVNLVVDEGVSGRVNADLQAVSLFDILEQVVRPRGFHYAIDGNTIRVFASDLETRVFQVAYPNTVRAGTAQFSVRGAVAQEIALTGDAAGAESGDVSQSNVSTLQNSDLWQEIESTLQLLVFGTERAPPADATGEAGAETQPDGAEGPQSVQASPGRAGDDGRRVVVSRQAGTVLVSAPKSALREVETYLERITSSLARQVIIDAHILEVTLDDDLDMGLDAEVSPGFGTSPANPAGTIVRAITGGLARDNAVFAQDLAPILSSGGFTFGIATDTVGAILTALQAQTDVKIVSAPRIATLNNHKALIKVVRNEVFFVGEVEVEVVDGGGSETAVDFEPTVTPVGITLDVTPYVSPEGEITLHVHPSISEIVEVRNQPLFENQTERGSLPVIDLRETDTLLRVGDGETIVIGGLIQERTVDVERKLPWFGDLPVIGQLLRQMDVEDRRSELVILITPTVLDPPTLARVKDSSLERLDELDRERIERRAIRSSWWR